MNTFTCPHQLVLITTSPTCQSGLCPCVYGFLIYLFPFFFALQKALDQMPLKEHTHTLTQTIHLCFIACCYGNNRSMKQNLDTSAGGKKIMYSLLCVSRIPYGSFLTLSRYLAVRICFWLSSRLKFRIYSAASGDFQSTVPVISLIPLLINKWTHASTGVVLLG